MKLFYLSPTQAGRVIDLNSCFMDDCGTNHKPESFLVNSSEALQIYAKKVRSNLLFLANIMHGVYCQSITHGNSKARLLISSKSGASTTMGGGKMF